MRSSTVIWLLCSGFVAFCFSAMEAMKVRNDARHLTAELYDLRRQSLQLRDENRSLALEYYTFTDYGEIRTRALALGMIEPSIEDGTMVHLPAAEKQ